MFPAHARSVAVLQASTVSAVYPWRLILHRFGCAVFELFGSAKTPLNVSLNDIANRFASSTSIRYLHAATEPGFQLKGGQKKFLEMRGAKKFF